MDYLHYILLLMMSMGAAFVQRVSGFGFGIFIMTLLPYLLPSYAEATTLSGVLALCTSLIIVLKHYKYLIWKKLAIILGVFLVVSFFAIHFVSLADDGMLKIFLGVILIMASAYFMFLSGRFSIRPTKPVQCLLGTLSGIMGGLFGMQGPPAVLYFVETAEKKEEYIIIAQMYFLIGNVCMTFYRAYYGFFTSEVAMGWLIGIPGVLIGTYIGNKMFERLSMTILRKIIYIYMAISGMLCFI